MLLARSRYHVYYAPLDDEVVVLAIWHASRGSGPPLRVKKAAVALRSKHSTGLGHQCAVAR